MQLDSETRPIGEILRAAMLIEREARAQPAPVARPRHDLGDEIAALDEQWVFRKA